MGVIHKLSLLGVNLDWVRELRQAGIDLNWLLGFAVPLAVVAIVWIIARTYRKVHLGEQELLLKRQMVEHGMSAEEIEQVLGASGDSEHFTQIINSPGAEIPAGSKT